jgi:hypothetical protein
MGSRNELIRGMTLGRQQIRRRVRIGDPPGKRRRIVPLPG